MRILICQLLAILVLFMSTEGACDIANDIHQGRDDHSHQLETDDSSVPDPDRFSDQDGRHCQHSCQSHMAGIAMSLARPALDEAGHYPAFDAAHRSGPSQAPPTPPPNA